MRVLSHFVTLAIVSFASVPCWATDNGGGGAVNADDLSAACRATYNACAAACDAMGGNKFSDTFAREACNQGCEEANSKCYASGGGGTTFQTSHKGTKNKDQRKSTGP